MGLMKKRTYNSKTDLFEESFNNQSVNIEFVDILIVINFVFHVQI